VEHYAENSSVEPLFAAPRRQRTWNKALPCGGKVTLMSLDSLVVESSQAF
jgi:hypothetical protein